MDDTILGSVKKLLGISEKDEAFDLDIVININSVFSTLYQIGVGEEEHPYIMDGTSTWGEVFSNRTDLVDFIKLYTYLKVRVIFDPPTSSFVLDALNKQIQELEWRIQIQAEYLDDFDSCNCEEEALPDFVVEDIWDEIMNKKED